MAESSLNLKLSCALNPNKHFICRELMILKCHDPEPCTAGACLGCISEQTDYTGKFKCPLCPNEHKKDAIVEMNRTTTLNEDIMNYKLRLSNELKPTLVSMLLKANKTHDRIIDKYSAKNKKYVLDNLFEYLEHTILVKVESLKYDLEKMETKVYKRIEKFRQKQKATISNYSHEIYNLQKKFQISSSILFKVENSLNNLVDALRSIEMLMLKLTNLNDRYSNDEDKTMQTDRANYIHPFRANNNNNNNRLPNRAVLGYLYGLLPLKSMDDKSLKDPTLEVIFLGGYVKSCCGIVELFGVQNHQLAMTDFSSHTVKLLSKYDSYLMSEIEMKMIDMFRLVKFKNFYAICTDCDELSLENIDHTKRYVNLYICDMDLNRVLIYDLGIGKLKRIITGTLGEDGKSLNEFECPRDVCYFDEKVYVLDQVKNSIDIFKRNGDYLSSFLFNNDYFTGQRPRKLVENPLSVRVNWDTIAIVDWKKAILLFDYQLNLKHTIDQRDLMSMYMMSDRLNQRSLKIFLHSQNGDFIGYNLRSEVNETNEQILSRELIFRKNFKNLKCSSEFMIYSLSTRTFILSLGWSKSIALIRF